MTFAFTVTDKAGVKWDVYRFTKDGKLGTMAFSGNPKGAWEIGVLEAGTLNQTEVLERLETRDG